MEKRMGTMRSQSLVNLATFEVPLDFDAYIPDSYPDIDEIISSKGTIKLSKLYDKNTLTVTGTVAIKIVYSYDDGSKTKTIRFYQSFSNTEKIDRADVRCVFIESKVDYLNHRLLNNRRVDFKGAVSINAKGIAEEPIAIYQKGDDNKLCLKSRTEEIDYIYETVTKQLSIKDEFLIGEELGECEIASTNTNVELIDCRRAQDKTVVKGNFLIEAELFCDGKINKYSYNLPFTQVFDYIGDESMKDFIDFNLSNEEFTLLLDGNELYLCVELKLESDLVVIASDVVIYYTDGYSMECECEFDYSNFNISKIIGEINDSFTDKTKIVSNSAIAQVLSVDMDITKSEYMFIENDCRLVVSANLCAVVLNEEGVFEGISSKAEFRLPLGCNSEGDECYAIYNLSIDDVSFSCEATNAIDVTVEMSVDGYAFDIIEAIAIKNVNLDYEKSKEQNIEAPLILYYGTAGENVWDIAKRYNANVDTIMSENKLTEDVLENKKLLLITIGC